MKKQLLITNQDLIKLIVKNEGKQHIRETIKALPRGSIGGLLLETYNDKKFAEEPSPSQNILGLTAIAKYQPELLSHVLKSASEEDVFESLANVCKDPENGDAFLKIINALPPKEVGYFISYTSKSGSNGLLLATKFKSKEVIIALLNKNESSELLFYALFKILLDKRNKDIFLDILDVMSVAQVDSFLAESPFLAIANSTRWNGLTAAANFQEPEVIDILLNKATPAGILRALDARGYIKNDEGGLSFRSGLGEIMEFASYHTQCRIMAAVDIFSVAKIINLGISKDILKLNHKLTPAQRIELARRYKNINKFAAEPSEEIRKNPENIKKFISFVKGELENNMPKAPQKPFKGVALFPLIRKQKKSKTKIFSEEIENYQEKQESYKKYLANFLSVLTDAIRVLDDNDKSKDILLAYATRLASLDGDHERALQFCLQIKNPMGLDTTDNLIISELLLMLQSSKSDSVKKSANQRNMHALFHGFNAKSHGDEQGAAFYNAHMEVIINDDKDKLNENSAHFDEEQYVLACQKIFGKLINEAREKVAGSFKISEGRKLAKALLAEIDIPLKSKQDLINIHSNMQNYLRGLASKRKVNNQNKEFVKLVESLKETIAMMIYLQEDKKKQLRQPKVVATSSVSFPELINEIEKNNKLDDSRATHTVTALVANLRGLTRFDVYENFQVMYQLMAKFNEHMPTINNEDLDKSLKNMFMALKKIVFSTLTKQIDNVLWVSKSKDGEEFKEDEESRTKIAALADELHMLNKEPTTKNLDQMQWAIEKFKIHFQLKSAALKDAILFLEDGIANRLSQLAPNDVEGLDVDLPEAENTNQPPTIRGL
jgi:hypothetical protein